MIFTAIGSSCIDVYYEVEELPQRGDKIEGTFTKNVVGGMIGNAASVLAGYGETVYMIDFLDDNDESKILLADLDKYNVKKDGVEVSSKYNNSKCLIIREKSGERDIIVLNGKNEKFELSSKQLNIIKKSDYIYSTVVDIKKINNYSRILKIIEENNIFLALDIEPSTIREENDFGILKKADLIFINEHALNKIEKLFGFERVKKQIEIVVLTIGEKGSKSFYEGGEIVHEPIKVKVVDTTGAGDTYNSSYLYGVSKGWDIRKCGDFATHAASEKIKRQGPRSGVREVKEIMKLMKD